MAEVRGLKIFAEHFSDWQEHYVLIGGVASSLAMDDAGLHFRTTKDLDIVLIIEVINPDFVAHLWSFIKAGGYQVQLKGVAGPAFYRFNKPSNEIYPYQLEFFSRMPEGLKLEDEATLTPLAAGEAIASLSAILLNDEYYSFLLEGREHNTVLSVINADRLIPFKMRAWPDLSARKQKGEKIDSKDIRKHRNDILHLTVLLNETQIILPPKIYSDMNRFLGLLELETVDMKSLGLRGTLSDSLKRLRLVFSNTLIEYQ